MPIFTILDIGELWVAVSFLILRVRDSDYAESRDHVEIYRLVKLRASNSTAFSTYDSSIFFACIRKKKQAIWKLPLPSVIRFRFGVQLIELLGELWVAVSFLILRVRDSDYAESRDLVEIYRLVKLRASNSTACSTYDFLLFGNDVPILLIR